MKKSNNFKFNENQKNIYVLMFEFIDVDQFFGVWFVVCFGKETRIAKNSWSNIPIFFFVDFISDASYKCNRMPEIPIESNVRAIYFGQN